MQAHYPLNGSFTKNKNYVWGGALTLAWKQLIEKIILQPIKIQSNKADALKITENYNQSPFNFHMLDKSSYYANAGFGNQTVRLINKQVHQKFPEKTTPKLEQNLAADSIISFAYFFKNMKFQYPFSKADVQFKNETVPGFEAKDHNHRSQIHVHDHKNDDNFIIQLKTTAKDDNIFIIKNEKEMKPEEVVEIVTNLKEAHGQLGPKDIFRMPKIALKHKRDVSELKGVFLKNDKFKQYFFEQIYEIINLDIDETGVKVENQGVIIMTRSLAPRVRRYVLDKPFWIVMREKQYHPYFVAYICNVNDH